MDTKLTKIEQMIRCAERAAEAAENVRKNAEKTAKEANAVAKSLRETGNIPINQTGWHISKLEADAVSSQDQRFHDLWSELREEAVEAARIRREAEKG